MFTLPLKSKTIPQLESLLLVLGSKEIMIRDVLVDTGFELGLALPIDLAYQINLQTKDFLYVQTEFADSDGILRCSKGNIKLDNKLFEVDILWLEHSDEALIGSGFFAKYAEILQLNYKSDTLSILLK